MPYPALAVEIVFGARALRFIDPKQILSHPKLKFVDLKLIFIDPTMIYSNPREKESERKF